MSSARRDGPASTTTTEELPAGAPLVALLTGLVQQGSPLVVHAGHYLLATDDCGRMVSSEEADVGLLARLPSGIRDHTHSTWQLACQLARAARRTEDVRLLVLVNDWQCVLPSDSEWFTAERARRQLRAGYYASEPTLPSYHRRTMRAHGLTEDAILKCSDCEWAWSEAALREGLRETVRRMFKEQGDNEGPLSEAFTPDGEPVISHQGRGLLYCGSTNCAGEVVELLRNLWQRGVRQFVNLYPADCAAFVEEGTRLAGSLFGFRVGVVVNVAVPTAPRESLRVSTTRWDAAASTSDNAP